MLELWERFVSQSDWRLLHFSAFCFNFNLTLALFHGPFNLLTKQNTIPHPPKNNNNNTKTNKNNNNNKQTTTKTHTQKPTTTQQNTTKNKHTQDNQKPQTITKTHISQNSTFINANVT